MRIFRYCCLILTKTAVCGHGLVKLPNIKFNEDPFGFFRGYMETGGVRHTWEEVPVMCVRAVCVKYDKTHFQFLVDLYFIMN